MKKEEEFKKRCAEILRNNLTFVGQVGDYVIHGALDALWNLHIEQKNNKKISCYFCGGEYFPAVNSISQFFNHHICRNCSDIMTIGDAKKYAEITGYTYSSIINEHEKAKKNMCITGTKCERCIKKIHITDDCIDCYFEKENENEKMLFAFIDYLSNDLGINELKKQNKKYLIKNFLNGHENKSI